MTLEDFKEVYEDATPEKLLRLLVDTLDHKGDDRVGYVQSQNPEVKEWYSREVSAMDDRAEWLWERLMDFIKGRYGRDPKKPQEFKEMWVAKNPGGLIYKRDIVHATGNSDQYPFPLWAVAEGHEAEQEAQTETIRAMVAAIERCPVYEDQLDPDAISKKALLSYLLGKQERFGKGFHVGELLNDIQEFSIKRRRMDSDGGQYQ